MDLDLETAQTDRTDGQAEWTDEWMDEMDLHYLGGLAGGFIVLFCECFVFMVAEARKRDRTRTRERKGQDCMNNFTTSFDTFLLVVYILFCFLNVSITGIAIERDKDTLRLFRCMNLLFGLCLSIPSPLASSAHLVWYISPLFFFQRTIGITALLSSWCRV